MSAGLSGPPEFENEREKDRESGEKLLCYNAASMLCNDSAKLSGNNETGRTIEIHPQHLYLTN